MRMTRPVCFALALCMALCAPFLSARAETSDMRLTTMYASFLMQFGAYIPAETDADAALTDAAGRYGENGALLPDACAGVTFYDRKGGTIEPEKLTKKTMTRVYAATFEGTREFGLDLSVLSECANLTKLTLYGVPVKGLDALQKCRNLTSLFILVSEPDAPMLAFAQARAKSLTELTVVSVADAAIDMAFLKKAGKLKTLTLLGGFLIGDGALSGLKALTRANLLFFGREALDLNALLEHETLAYLDASWNELTGLDLLGQPVNRRIRTLNLSHCGLTGVPFIRKMSRLTSLDLSDNELTDLSDALTGKGNLETLTLDGNPIANASDIPWAGMESLTELQMNGCGLSDIAFMKPLKTLVTLGLSGNGIGDISVCAGCKNLVALDLSDNNVADVTPLSGLKHLRGVNLRGNAGLIDVTPLAACAKMSVLYAPQSVPDENLLALHAALPDCLIER